MDDSESRFTTRAEDPGVPPARPDTDPGGDPAGSDAVTAELTRLRRIAGKMVLGVVAAMGVLWQLTTHFRGSPEAAPGPNRAAAALVLLAAVLLVAAPVVERLLLARGGSTTAGAGGEGPLRRYHTAKMVSLVLRQLVGSLGLVVGFLSGRALWGYALGAASLLAIAIAWPRATDFTAQPADLSPSGNRPPDPF